MAGMSHFYYLYIRTIKSKAMKNPILYTLLTLIIMNAHTITGAGRDKTAVEIFDNTIYQLGEGALWDQANQRLLYIDILGKQLVVYYPDEDRKYRYDMPSMIGTVVCESENTVLVALQDGIYRYSFDSGELDFLACPPENDDTQRFNDGKCDPAGRFWVGTMSLQREKKASHLFRFDGDGSIHTMLDGITISNGIVWNSSKTKMYYIDTPTHQVMEYRYDHETGTISEPRVAVDIPDGMGGPDGMTIDSEDKIWVAMWGGSAVCRFDPLSGELLEKIPVPARNVTSCAFGGPELKTLYITTARQGTSEEELRQFPDAGKSFKIKLNHQGVPGHCYYSR